jgi:hypothetical protein
MRKLHLVALAGLLLASLGAGTCEPDPPPPPGSCRNQDCGPPPPVPPCGPGEVRTAPLTCARIMEACAWRIGPCAVPDGGAR